LITAFVGDNKLILILSYLFIFLRLLCVLLTAILLFAEIFGNIAANEICNKTRISNFILMRDI